MSDGRKGMVFSKEHCINISKTKNGFKHSEETLKKMSVSHKGKCTIKVINITTGEIFNSVTEAAIAYSSSTTNISKACRGKRKIAGGCSWSYIIKEKVGT